MNDDDSLYKHFDEIIEFIDKHRKNKTNVFVHCYAGISRSATAVIAYLMKKNNWDYHSAFVYCKQRRNVIFPNLGFIK